MVNKPLKMDWKSYSNHPNFYAEPKFDGMRIQIVKDDKVRLLRENGNDYTKQFPELTKSLNAIPFDSVLDGEICILENEFVADFQKLQTRRTSNDLKIKLLSQKIPATFVAFDIVRYEGENLLNEPLHMRKEYLKNITQTENLQVIKQYGLDELKEIIFNLKNAEGIVLKDPNSNYNEKWLKYRKTMQSDYKVVGYTSEKKLISALELENNKGESVGKVNYTGYPMTNEWKNKVVGMTAVVDHMTTNDGKVRFPVLKELRS
jgi:ATP-dependent DNA ligase